MFKKKQKAAAAASPETPAAPKRRSKLKLALIALVPLVVAGGGFAGWPFVAPAIGLGAPHAPAEGEAAAGEGADHGVDDTHVSALPPEAVAENSFTYSFALSELLKGICGEASVPSLRAASDTEAKADGAMVNLAWIAANRRVGTVTEVSCDRMASEIFGAEIKAAELTGAGAAKDKKAAAAHH